MSESIARVEKVIAIVDVGFLRVLGIVVGTVMCGCGSEVKHKWVTTNAHIVSAEHHHGPLPEGKTEWRHTCDTANCVAPHHLIPGTHKENMQDAIDRNRGMFGRFKENTTDEKEYEECPF
jgi:hypothetical protein